MSAPEGHRGIILVADDNEANRDLLSELLSAEGYQVVCTTDGQQALARVNSDSMDLALLDVVMPRPTGYEVCQAMKSRPETRLVPVVLLTSLNSDADRIHGIMCGADDFAQVPLTARILQVTDIYDALTTDRPYRKALPPEKAIAIPSDRAGGTRYERDDAGGKAGVTAWNRTTRRFAQAQKAGRDNYAPQRAKFHCHAAAESST